MKHHFKALLVLACCVQMLQAWVIIWDFGGVIFEPNKLGVAREIGLWYFLSYALFDQKNPNIQELLFDVLDKLQPGGTCGAGTPEGMPLPPIMCDWQTGTQTGPEIVKKVIPFIEELEKIGYWKSPYEKRLVAETMKKMFDPDVLARNVDVQPGAVALLRACAKARNEDGSKINLNIGFSNWDPLSFKKFYQNNYSAGFKYFDSVIISGSIGLIKPDPRAYRYLLKKNKFKPHECILIDDQKINIESAKKVGMLGILVQHNDFEKVRKKLINLGALAPES